ncbi:DUF4240 domain-containing protein [Nonomuraea sp. GTA35]|uniref:DUF4240 domain-containing protein n=1 Tax=Nonomuraea sp. GTA35 TaxID=1676746 RepID=UPI0035C1DD70
MEEIIDFHMWMFLCEKRAETWELFGAAGLLFGITSGNRFQYFVRRLISLGRQVYEAAMENPDNLIEVSAVRERVQYRHSVGVLPEELSVNFETLGYVSIDAYKRATSKEAITLWEAVEARGVEIREPFRPRGEYWDDNEDAQWRLPRIYRYLSDLNA